MLSFNSKHVQHVKIYLACNFKVNLITHLEVIALFSSNFKNVNTFHPWTLHRCFLPSLAPFGQAVSEEKFL
jgi:hypothetical protein